MDKQIQPQDEKPIVDTLGTNPPKNKSATPRSGGSPTLTPEPTGDDNSGENKLPQDDNDVTPAVLNLPKVEDSVSAFDYFDQKFKNSEEASVIDAKYDARAKESSTKSANFVAQNAQKANENYVRNEYQANQTVDKSGWTGGYALDTARQLDYLKSSIQADIFSQQELQKLGYQSALDQARMAAEQEKNELAFQRYQAAQQEAINKAQITGMYVEPHIADMLVQVNAAESILNGKNSTQDEKDKAQRVKDYITAQFNKMNIKPSVDSKTGYISWEGIKTLEYIQTQSDEFMKNFNYQLALDKIQKENPKAIIPYFDDQGRILGYKETLPDKGPAKEKLQKYYKDNPEEFKAMTQKILGDVKSQYLEAKKKDPSLDINKFVADKYNGNDLGKILDAYTKGTTSIKGQDITLEKVNGVWTYSTTAEPEKEDTKTKDKNGNILLSQDDNGDDIKNDFLGSGKNGDQDDYYMAVRKAFLNKEFNDGDIITFNYGHNETTKGIYQVKVTDGKYSLQKPDWSNKDFHMFTTSSKFHDKRWKLPKGYYMTADGPKIKQ